MGDAARAGLGKTPEYHCFQGPILQVWRLRPREAQVEERELQESVVLVQTCWFRQRGRAACISILALPLSWVRNLASLCFTFFRYKWQYEQDLL